MAKITADYLELSQYGRAYNYKHYTKEECVREYLSEFQYYGEEVSIEDYEPFVSYFRYITKAEIVANGDWEEIIGYEEGYMTKFEECEPNDKGAFKCWVIGD